MLFRSVILFGYLNALRNTPSLVTPKRTNSIKEDKSLLYWATATLSSDFGKYDVNSIKSALTLFDEDKDKLTFQAELAFLRLQLYKDKVAPAVNSFTEEDLVRAQSLMHHMVKSGDIPKILAPSGMSKSEFEFCLVTNFALQQYAYQPYVVVESGDVFLDCGACCGDTAIWALNNGAKTIYSFEPNLDNLAALQENAKNIGNGNIIALPYGIGIKEEKLGLIGKAGSARTTKNINNADYIIDIITIDQWCFKNNIVPNFIKMDIEGAEIDALQGAKTIIQKYKPKLAICLYHKMSHMWEIPLLIKSLCDEYSFWCRKNDLVHEFVLYAAVK